jgi:hypothetical protein
MINIHSRFCSTHCKAIYSGVTGTRPGLSLAVANFEEKELYEVEVVLPVATFLLPTVERINTPFVYQPCAGPMHRRPAFRFTNKAFLDEGASLCKFVVLSLPKTSSVC